MRLESPVLASPQLPDQVRREQSRIPVRQSPMEPVQPARWTPPETECHRRQGRGWNFADHPRLAQRKN